MVQPSMLTPTGDAVRSALVAQVRAKQITSAFALLHAYTQLHDKTSAVFQYTMVDGLHCVSIIVKGAVCASATAASKKQAKLIATENFLRQACPEALALLQPALSLASSSPEPQTGSPAPDALPAAPPQVHRFRWYPVEPLRQSTQVVHDAARGDPLAPIAHAVDMGHITSLSDALDDVAMRLHGCPPMFDVSRSDDGDEFIVQVHVRGVPFGAGASASRDRARSLAIETALRQLAPTIAAQLGKRNRERRQQAALPDGRPVGHYAPMNGDGRPSDRCVDGGATDRFAAGHVVRPAPWSNFSSANKYDAPIRSTLDAIGCDQGRRYAQEDARADLPTRDPKRVCQRVHEPDACSPSHDLGPWNPRRGAVNADGDDDEDDDVPDWVRRAPRYPPDSSNGAIAQGPPVVVPVGSDADDANVDKFVPMTLDRYAALDVDSLDPILLQSDLPFDLGPDVRHKTPVSALGELHDKFMPAASLSYRASNSVSSALSRQFTCDLDLGHLHVSASVSTNSKHAKHHAAQKMIQRLLPSCTKYIDVMRVLSKRSTVATLEGWSVPDR
ncbi:unnamed protein product (mitochondrion) [Plasmodiophora brassicae]|uniref:DRBM domain-containing protein n=1 Tax=Plasmodiophora brassicae TaxID=37360 RepID=A0A0G4J1I1_PLABS|nr:hypothetical protein PBRA_002046 [Plasmodiophora brassicae]SPR01451.1 unnamed protein product [Plasmodiophora brassicae]